MSKSVVLLASFLVLISCGYSGHVAELEKQNQQLQAKVDELSKGISLDLTAKCSKQAQAIYDRVGDKAFGSFQNHYNVRLQKCIMLLTSMDIESKPWSMRKKWGLFDAFDNKGLGSFDSTDGEKYKGTFIDTCDVVSIATGERQKCSSQEEFTKLIAEYLEK